MNSCGAARTPGAGPRTSLRAARFDAEQTPGRKAPPKLADTTRTRILSKQIPSKIAWNCLDFFGFIRDFSNGYEGKK
jgi:hypothetical protein